MGNKTLLFFILMTGVFGILNTERGFIGIPPYIAKGDEVPIARAGLVLPGGDAARQTPGENAPPAISGENPRHAGTGTGTTEKEALASMTKNLRIKIGNRVYSAVLEDSQTAREFVKLLPREMMMRELNGNEKYCRLSDALPAKDENPRQIHAGDLMLFGGDTVVLFYKDLATGYRYTRLGRITDPGGLAEAVGDGDVPVTMDTEERK